MKKTAGILSFSIGWMRRVILLACLFPVLLCSSLHGDEGEYDYVRINFGRISSTNFSAVVGSGARAMGMGGAFIAVADDATAASWNPAGLGQLERPEFTFVGRAQDFRISEPATNEPFLTEVTGDFSNVFFGPAHKVNNSYGFDFISFTYPIRAGRIKLVSQFSYQRSLNYDMRSSEENIGFLSEYYNIDGVLFQSGEGSIAYNEKYSGGIDTFSFSLGTRIFRRLNIGISLNYWTNGFIGNLESQIRSTLVFSESGQSVEAIFPKEKQFTALEVRGINVNVGLLVEVTNRLKIGAVYKSSFNPKLDLEIVLEEEGRPGSQVYETKSRLKWPQTWGVGVSYRPIDVLTVAVDYTQTQWSRSIIKDYNDKGLFRDVFFPTLYPVLPELDDEEEDEDDIFYPQKNTRQLRLGLEYVFLGKKHIIPVRVGVFADTQYYTDTSGRKITFTGFTAGVGYKRGFFSLDLALMYETGKYLEYEFDYTLTQVTEFRGYVSMGFKL